MTNRKPGRRNDYRIDVEDFGPIHRASMDVRPLTVFIGPSNTGKSYLAILVHALHRSLDMNYGRMPWLAALDARIEHTTTPGDELLEDLRTWAENASEEEPMPAPPGNVTAHIDAVMRDAKWLESALTDELRRCFGVDRLDVLARRPGTDVVARVGLGGAGEAGPETARYELRFGAGDHRLSGHRFPISSHWPDAEHLMDMVAQCTTVISFDDDSIEENFDAALLFRLIVAHLFRAAIVPLRRRTYYLPADRTGVMHSHQVIVSTLVQGAATIGLRPSTNVPMLSGVLADFLNQLIGMPGERSPAFRSPVADLAAGLEHAVLRGAVRMTRTETGYPRFTYRPDGWKDDLPLMRTSSMVSELAPVVLYVRHLVQRGDILIIEEPESHLHPAMQAAFARELARLVRTGVRIVITTHSEWFLEQIGNLVRLSSLPEKRREGITGADGRAVAGGSRRLAVQARPGGVRGGGSRSGPRYRPVSDRLRRSEPVAVQRGRGHLQPAAGRAARMSGLVQAVTRHVDVACRKRGISKRGCSVSMHGVPVEHVAVDLDCDALEIPAGRKRCDYLFFGKGQNVAWVSPIELKGGAFRGGSVAAQLQGGADIADAWIPARLRFRFVPVLASGQGQRVHRERLRALRRKPITLRGQSRQPVLIRCGSRLMEALERAPASG